jgi:hypothetical protein
VAELHDVLPRRRTPGRLNDDGSTTLTVQRCCNGCGEPLGDVAPEDVPRVLDMLGITGADGPESGRWSTYSYGRPSRREAG